MARTRVRILANSGLFDQKFAIQCRARGLIFLRLAVQPRAVVGAGVVREVGVQDKNRRRSVFRFPGGAADRVVVGFGRRTFGRRRALRLFFGILVRISGGDLGDLVT